jgi:hypothetical protein
MNQIFTRFTKISHLILLDQQKKRAFEKIETETGKKQQKHCLIEYFSKIFKVLMLISVF